MSTKVIQNYGGLILGYYPLRGKIQICRLLCEYLHINYKDLLFTPKTWQQFKTTQTIKWNYQELPFLKEGDFVITQTIPISYYIIQRANRQDLLGKNPIDQAKVDMFIWQTDIMNNILALLATFKQMEVEKKYQTFEKFWHDNLKQKFIKIQHQIEGDGFYIGYMTIVDFYIYDLWYFFKLSNIQFYMLDFPKFTHIYNSIAGIEQIMAYEQSNKAIKSISPAGFYEKWKSIVKETEKA